MIYDHEHRANGLHGESMGRRSDPRPPPQSIWWPPAAQDLWYRQKWYLRDRGLSPEVALSNGWYPAWLNARPYIIIPATGSTPFWQGRSMASDGLRFDSSPVPRGNTVVYLTPQRSSVGGVVVEGPMDALAAAECGYYGVALMGNTPPLAALGLTWELLRGMMVLIIEDRDGPGALSRTFAYLATMGCRCNITSCPSPWKDLAEMPMAKRCQWLNNLFAHE